MKSLAKFAALGAVLAASTPLAFATPITGQITITGNDTFDTSNIAFTAGTGQVGTSSISGTTFTLNNPVSLISGFTYTPGTFGTPIEVFSTTENGLTLAYYLQTIVQGQEVPTNIPGIGTVENLAIIGSGYFTLTGYDNTVASFDLNSQQGISPTISFSDTSFAAAATTPEPNSLLLMGTGLLGAAGLLVARRRNAAELL